MYSSTLGSLKTKEHLMGRPKDDWTEQVADEELDSLGEGARRDLMDSNDDEGDDG